MKFVIVFALFALVAAKPSRLSQAEIDEIVAAINSPNSDPATAAALEQMLLIALGITEPAPIQVGPEIIDFEPIHVGPEIVDVDTFEPIHIGPEIVDFPVVDSVVAPTPISSPLMQIIVNVNKPENFPGGSPVVVEDLDKPEPIDKPTPVHVAEYNPVVMEPVIVADNLPPLMISPVAVGPEILN